MKKILVILVISFLCFGCSKDTKNITINIYNNENIAEEKENINSKQDVTTDSRDNEANISFKETVKETYNSSKTWYDNNKDELLRLKELYFNLRKKYYQMIFIGTSRNIIDIEKTERENLVLVRK